MNVVDHPEAKRVATQHRTEARPRWPVLVLVKDITVATPGTDLIMADRIMADLIMVIRVQSASQLATGHITFAAQDTGMGERTTSGNQDTGLIVTARKFGSMAITSCEDTKPSMVHDRASVASKRVFLSPR
jgi:hypothetical protein